MDKKTNPIVRVLPSLTDLAFLMPIVFLFTRMDGVKSMLGDGDTGWHIRTGQWILANGRVPHKDIFSYTKPGDPWYAWEWLWDVCFAWLYDHGGLAIVVAVNIVLISLTFALLFRLVQRHCENPFVAIAVTFLACSASSLHWLARPHLVTMLFTVILLFVLNRDREARTRWLWALPVFFILWTNLHGGFLVGLIVIAGYMAGELATGLFTADSPQRRASLASAKRYALTVLACAAATIVNPYTYHLHAHIYQFLTEPYHLQHINEYQSISFHSAAALYVEFLILFGAFSAAWFVVKRRDFVPLVLIAGWAHLALFAARNIPLFGIVAAPFVAQAVSEMLRGLEQAQAAAWLHRAIAGFRTTAAEFSATDRQWRLHVASVAAALIVTLLIANPNASGKLEAGVRSQGISGECLGRVALRARIANLRRRRMGRLSALSALSRPQGFRRRPGRLLRAGLRTKIFGRDQRKVQLGAASRQVPSGHDRSIHHERAGRRDQRIQPLAHSL